MTAALLLRRRRRRGIFLQQRILQRAEQQRERKEAEHLEIDPGVGRGVAPNDLVENRERKEEDRPAQRQLAPPFLGEVEQRIEQHPEQRFAEQETAQQHGAEQRIEHGGLDLDERLVVQDERQPAEHEHDDRRT